MSNDQIIKILLLILVFCIFTLLIVVAIYFIKKSLNNKPSTNLKSTENEAKPNNKEITLKSYTKDSIYNFMEFDKVEDNMIIQKDGKKFLMVVECQGINYDLMSQTEQIAVEEGFIQFLNSLRYPIQIYIQSRTINLTLSIENYRKKVDEYRVKLEKMLFDYKVLQENKKATYDVLQKYNYEITKQRNLYEYGQDIIAATERMNLNKNVLNRKYYIVLSYFGEEANNANLDKEEIKNAAFSELYTRAQSVIRTLMSCEINSKILDSTELVNLLYIAYNRDESEVFDIEKAVEMGCDDLYSTAPDIFEKKIKILDEVIEKKAKERADEAYIEAKTEKQKIAEEKMKNMENMIDEKAKDIIYDYVKYIGKDLAEESVNIINKKRNKRKKEGSEEINEKPTRRSSKQQ